MGALKINTAHQEALFYQVELGGCCWQRCETSTLQTTDSFPCGCGQGRDSIKSVFQEMKLPGKGEARLAPRLRELAWGGKQDPVL